MKKNKLIENQKKPGLTPQQEKEIEEQLCTVQNKILQKADEKPRFILVDGVAIQLLERVLNEAVPIEYEVFKMFTEVFMIKPSNLMAANQQPTAITMYYMILKMRD